MIEVEKKFPVTDRDDLLQRLNALGSISGEVEQHSDTYYQHPSRDFAQTQEALRIRRVDGVASVTYKGRRYVQADSSLKARQELEWCLGSDDHDGANMDQLLIALGFTMVATVNKLRQSFHWATGEWSDFSVTLDEVAAVGLFAEIELLVRDESQIAESTQRIAALTDALGLCQPETRSYLRMTLEQQSLNSPSS
ncbi:class IV adenylate cyclase [Stieleria varia]|uniref:CYTH domain protein n=1 Tax=Stieleria varia TaxID=2528005 RepID=A0A5C5ZZV6_9BACT|nr:class IV adenylate cyclase [Stieleria varia]TWT92665.1 CYTH domain protein [Stieleria varia]